MYSISAAHADGRHASQHLDDLVFWIASGCTDCRIVAGDRFCSDHDRPTPCRECKA